MDLIVLVLMPPALSSTTIDPGSTAIEITGATSASSTGIKRVVDQLLEHDERPLLDAVPGLVLQFPPGAELHQPRDPEGNTGQLRLRFLASGRLGLCHNL